MGRKRFLMGTLLLVGAVAVGGCVTLRVNMDYDREADFSMYQSYAWQESDVSLADDDPLMHQRLIQAVDDQLSAKGLQKLKQTLIYL